MKKYTILLLFLLSQSILFAQAPSQNEILVPGIVNIERVSSNVEESENVDSFGANLRGQSPTGNSEEIGITAGQLSVSLGGAANYSLPIAIPPGAGEIQPSIKLSYNSQSGNGIAGYGWEISGVSMITLIPATKFHDGTINGIDLNNANRFALDGERLILKNPSDTYGADGTEYQTENFSNLKIVAHGTSSTFGPQYFTIKYPDGSESYYGITSDSRSINTWAVSYSVNPRSLAVKYSYAKEDNALYIIKVSYGATYLQPQINEINFLYTNRARSEQAYLNSGFSIIRNLLLSEIRVTGSGTGFRNYVLGHDSNSLDYQRLVSVTEKSGDYRTSLNPTVFTYDNSPSSVVYNTVSSSLAMGHIDYTNSVSFSGDFNADGKMDFVIYPTTQSYAKTKFYLFKDINGQSRDWGYEVPTGKFEEIFPSSWLNYEGKLMPNQGITAIVDNHIGSAGSKYFDTYSLVTSTFVRNRKQFVFPTYMPTGEIVPVPNNCNYKVEKDIPKKYYSGDFNGDGITDVIAFEEASFSYNQYFGCYLNSSGQYITIPGATVTVNNQGRAFFVNLDQRNTSTSPVELQTSFLTTGAKIIVADANGDGKSDLFVFKQGIVKVYTMTDNNILSEIASYSSTAISVSGDKPIIMGDYNGDGKADFITPISGTSYSRFLFTGDSFAVKTLNNIPFVQSTATGNCSNSYHIIPNDYNQDGKTDLIIVANIGCFDSASIILKYYKNTGLGFVSDMTADTGTRSNIARNATPIFLNFDKTNGHLDINFLTKDNVINFTSKKSNSSDMLLKAVTLGNGVTERITYSSLAKGSVVYTDTAYTETYPNVDVLFTPTIKIVSRIENESQHEYKKQDYRYHGAVYNNEGLGFLGFRSILMTNWYNDDHPVISTVSKYDMQKRGALSESYTVLGFDSPSSPIVPTSFISRTVKQYEDFLYPNKVYKIKNTETTTYDGLQNISKKIITYFDDYNNPVSKYDDYLDGTSTRKQLDVTLIEYENMPNSDRYYIGRPIKKNTVSFGTTELRGEEIYTYDNAGLVSHVSIQGNNTDYVTQDITYDLYGNPTKKTSTAGNVARSLEYRYDTTGRFLIKSFNTEGLVKQCEYSIHGLVKSQTDPYGNKISYEYDLWGNKNKITDYLGKETNIIYSKDEATTIITTIGDDGSSTVKKYDDLGREKLSGSKMFDSSWSYVKTDYDIYGRATKVGEPVDNISGTATLSSITEYDNFGRVSRAVAANGGQTTFTYEGLITTVTDSRKSTVYIKDAVGNTISKTENGFTENGGTINYEYYPDGNLKKIGADGIETLIENDGWGRRIQLIDPSAGTISYEYNGFGELTKQITPTAFTEFTMHPVSGKLLSKAVSGQGTSTVTNYMYNANSKLLEKVTHEDIITGVQSNQNFGYDDKMRLNFTDENNGIAYYQQATTFDEFGRSKYELFTAISILGGNKRTDKWTENVYQNGSHWKTLDYDTQQLIWQNKSVNARGQLTEASYGNGVNILFSYDQYGYMTKLQNQKSSGGLSDLLTLNYDFDIVTGNLKSRENTMFNWYEDFKYDSLDRLKEFTNVQGLAQQQVYDSKGRITENSIGKYSYGRTKPYQNNNILINTKSLSYYSNREGLFNDSMENSQGWTTYYNPGNITYDTTKKVSGEHSIKLTASTPEEIMVFSEKQIPIDNASDTYYTYSAWMFSEGPQAEVFLYMKSAEETSSFTLVDNIRDSTTGIWKFVTKTFLVPANMKYLSIRLDNNGGNGSVWYDDVQVKRTDDPSNALRKLNIKYNASKNPISIDETGVDKINFLYNHADGRSTMYYGGLQDDKNQRQYVKSYSSDGSMEIKFNRFTQEVEFLTYVGGSVYTAPAICRSNGSQSEYLYLHRDYQQTILAVSNQNGDVIEKRIFDAWGNIAKVEDGNGNVLSQLKILDRGYTGHEHLQSVGLINMNARLYDPLLSRFLQPDTDVQDLANLQNYNRYGYVLNNPLKYADYSGNNYDGGSGGPSNGSGEGISGEGQQAIGITIKSIADNWDEIGIKDWAKKNFNLKRWDKSVKSATNWASDNFKKGTSWIEKQVNSILKKINGKKSKPETVGLPASEFSGAQISGGWQESGFKGNDSSSAGDWATAGSVMGGINGMLTEHRAFSAYRSVPNGHFVAEYNGTIRYWKESFQGGTRGNISNEFVKEALAKSNSYKNVIKYAKGAGIIGSIVGYYGAAENYMNGDLFNGNLEMSANSVSIAAGYYFGADVGLAVTVGWESGRWITQQEWYNTFFYGKNSDIWKQRDMEYGWWKKRSILFKDLPD